MFFVFVTVYLYTALTINTLSKKLGVDNRWLSFVPGLNTIQFVRLTGRSGWWVLILLVPLANVVFTFIFFSEILGRRGFKKSGWWIFIFPVVSYIKWAIVAFSESPSSGLPTRHGKVGWITFIWLILLVVLPLIGVANSSEYQYESYNDMRDDFSDIMFEFEMEDLNDFEFELEAF